MSTFSGLCVGGVADGEMCESNSRVLIVARSIAPKLLWRNDDIRSGIAVELPGRLEKTAYSYLEQGGLRLWVPSLDVGEATRKEVMARLCAVYAKATHLRYEDFRTLMKGGANVVSVAQLLEQEK